MSFRSRLAALSLAPLAALSFAPLAACDDDGGTSVTVVPFEATAADEQPLKDLDDAGRTALCAEADAWFDTEITEASQRKLGCTAFIIAFGGGADKAACASAVNECVADTETQVSAGSLECEAAKLAGCDATVGELEACYTAFTTSVKGLAARGTCSIGVADLAALDTPPSACAPVQTKCPQVFDDSQQ